MNPFSKNYVSQLPDSRTEAKRIESARKGRAVSAAQNIGWGNGTIVLAGTPKHLAPGDMPSKPVKRISVRKA